MDINTINLGGVVSQDCPFANLGFYQNNLRDNIITSLNFHNDVDDDVYADLNDIDNNINKINNNELGYNVDDIDDDDLDDLDNIYDSVENIEYKEDPYDMNRFKIVMEKFEEEEYNDYKIKYKIRSVNHSTIFYSMDNLVIYIKEKCIFKDPYYMFTLKYETHTSTLNMKSIKAILNYLLSYQIDFELKE